MPTPAWFQSPMMKAARREPVGRTPIWLMHQAGRFLPEYRRLRQKTPFLDLCKNPGLCAEIAISTVGRLRAFNAAIVFSDLLLILEPMGMRLDFRGGTGPASRQSDPHCRRCGPPAGIGVCGAAGLCDRGRGSTRAGLSEPDAAYRSRPGRLRSRWLPMRSKAAAAAIIGWPRPSCTPTPAPGTPCWVDCLER